MPPARIIFALILTGFYAIVSQILIIREFLTTFSGNELGIGIFLSNWLLLEAIGSYFGGRFSKKIRLPAPTFTAIQLLLSLCLPVIIYGTRFFKLFITTSIGEMIPIPHLLIASMILLFPIAFFNGAQFSLGCQLLSTTNNDSRDTIGIVYIFEALGSLAGGVVVTYFCLTHLNIFQSVFLLALLNSISALLLLKKEKTYNTLSKNLWTLHLLFLLLIAFSFLMAIPTTIHNYSRALLWPGYEVVTSQNSIYGNSVLLERDDQFELVSNGVPLLSFPTSNISDVENVAHLPLLFHPEPNSALLVGGGLNGVLKEMLKHSLQKIDYAELDPVLTTIILTNIPNSGSDYLNNERIHIHQKDGRQLLISNNHLYDVIILNLPDPSTLEINRFYTREFFALCKDHLAPSGVLFLNLPGGASYINTNLMQLNACILASLDTVFQYSRVFPYETTMVLASDHHHFRNINPDTLSRRLVKREIATHSLSARYFLHLLNPGRIEWFIKEKQLMEPPAQNLDFHPLAVYYDLIYWNTLVSPTFSRLFFGLQEISLPYMIAFIILVFLILSIFTKGKLKKELISTGIVITTSGFTGMGLTLIMILSFQAIFGYVYFWIGMIVGSFMLGLAAGGMVSTRYWIRGNNNHRVMFMTEMGLVGYFLLLLTIFLWFNQTTGYLATNKMIPALILLMTGLCGFAMGSQFPLAGQIYQKKINNTAKAAGMIYSFDLLGAWSAGIIISLYWIPLFGISNTLVIFVTIKMGSTLILYLAGKSKNSEKTG